MTHRVLITLPPHATDLGQLQLAGRTQTEIDPGTAINTVKAPAVAHQLAEGVTAPFVAKTTAMRGNAPRFIKISALSFAVISVLLRFITEHLLTVF